MLTYLRHDHTKVYIYQRNEEKTRPMPPTDFIVVSVVREGSGTAPSNRVRSCGCLHKKTRIKNILERDQKGKSAEGESDRGADWFRQV